MASFADLLTKTVVMIMVYVSTELLDGHYDVMKPQVIAFAKALPALYLSYQTITGSTSGPGANNLFSFYPKIFGVGLFFCGFGDAALRLEDVFLEDADKYFLAGIVFFLVGHVFFTIGFYFKLSNLSRLCSSSTFGSRTISVSEPSWFPSLLVCSYCGFMMHTLIPSIAEFHLKIGVSIYVLVIGFMFFISIRTFRLERRAISRLENSSTVLTKGQVQFWRSLLRNKSEDLVTEGELPVDNGTKIFPSYLFGTVCFLMSDSILGYSKWNKQTVLSLFSRCTLSAWYSLRTAHSRRGLCLKLPQGTVRKLYKKKLTRII